MKNSVIASVVCAFAMIGAAAEARPFVSDDLVRLTRLGDYAAAPDGRSVVYIARRTDLEANHGVKSLWTKDVGASGAPARVLISEAEDSSVSSPKFSQDGKGLYFISSRSGSDQVWKLDLATGVRSQVTALPLDVATFRVSDDQRHIVVSVSVFPDCPDLACTKARLAARAKTKASGQMFDRVFIRHWDTWADGTRNHLIALSLKDGVAAEPVDLTQGFDGDVPSKPDGGDDTYALTPDGQTVIFSARLAGKTEPWSTNFDLYKVAITGGALTDLTPDNPAWDAGPVVSPDGRWLAYRAMKRPGFEADRFQIRLKDLKTGAVRDVAANWDRSAGGLAWSLDGKTLYADADDVGSHKLFAIDLAKDTVRSLTGAGHVSGFSVTGAGLIYSADSLLTPDDLYLLSPTGKSAAITDLASGQMSGFALGAPKQFSFTGWNGETVYGYVVLPPGLKPGAKVPVAFLIHGGPQGSFGDGWSYRWNAQTYVGQGFAAVMVDFHGSTGYGQAFTDAISQHWGDRPLEDLQKGYAAALAQFPQLDASRACALGASYGGYMIDWIAGNWNAPWRCLVSHAGPFDTTMMGSSTEELWFSEWENGGTPYDNLAAYEKFNPARHTKDWIKPMMISQGSKDFRIPQEQSIGAFTTLQRRGVPSQFLLFPDENHWILKPQNSLQWHHAVEAWIKQWTAGS